MTTEDTIVKGITTAWLLYTLLFDDPPPKIDKKLPVEEYDSIAFHFGEFRLICIDYMQTTLLLLRGTGEIKDMRDDLIGV